MISDTVFFAPSFEPRSHPEVDRTGQDNAAAKTEDDPGLPGDVAPVSAPLDPAGADDSPGGDLAGVDGYSDVGNGARFVADHGDSLRFVATGGRWLVWDERRWVPDGLNRSLAFAIQTARKAVALAKREDRRAAQRACALEVASATAAATLVAASDDRRVAARALVNATGLLQVTRMNHMVTAATAMGLGITEDELDGHPMLLNVANGTLDLATGLLGPHRREDLITDLADIVFDPDATCPKWDALLAFVTCGDQGLEAFLQRAVGYSLTGIIREHALFFIHGGGANAKSTFLKVLLGLLGDAGMQAPENLLMARQGEVHPTGQADLCGRRVAVTTEVDEGKRLSEALVKQLTGGDRIRARRMRENHFEFAPTHKLWLSGNHLPVILGNDLAVWRRVKLIPFKATVAPGEIDTGLPDKLAAEMSGILAWAVRGCLIWQAEGLGSCAAVEAGTKGYRTEMDALGLFIDECVTEALDGFTPSIDLYVAYQGWARRSGELVMSRRALGNRLVDRGWVSGKRGANGNMAWLGRSLKEDARSTRGWPF